MTTSPTLYDFVMAQLRAKKIPQRQIARESGVPFSTVCKIAQGCVTDPSVHTVQRLADYFTSEKGILAGVEAGASTPDFDSGSGDPRHGERRAPEKRARIDRRKKEVS